MHSLLKRFFRKSSLQTKSRKFLESREHKFVICKNFFP